MTVPQLLEAEGHVPSSGVREFLAPSEISSSHGLAELADHLLLKFAVAVDDLEAGLGQQLDTHVAAGPPPPLAALRPNRGRPRAGTAPRWGESRHPRGSRGP